MKSSIRAFQSKRTYSKKGSRHTYKRTKQATLPSHTYLANDLFHDLHHLLDLSCERTRGYIAVHPTRATFVRELHAFAYELYVLARNSLREHLKHINSTQVKVDPIISWRWAQEQVSSVISKSMPHDPHVDLVQAKVEVDRAALQWTAEAFSDPRVCGLFFQDKWRAPAFMFEDEIATETDVAATKEQSTSLVAEVQNEIVTALQNARYDAYQWILGRPREAKARVHRSEIKIRIAEILNSDPTASNAHVAAALDEKGIPISKGWRSGLVTNWVSALSDDTKFHDVEVVINKVRRDLGCTKH